MTKKYNRNFWIALLCATLTLLWVISLLPFGKGTWNLGAFLSIVAAVLAVLNVLAWRKKKSVRTIVGDFISKIFNKPTSTTTDIPDDQTLVSKESLKGMELYKGVGPDGKPIERFGQKKVLMPKGKVPTLVEIASADGKLKEYLVIPGDPKDKAKAPADMELGTLNNWVPVKKAPTAPAADPAAMDAVVFDRLVEAYKKRGLDEVNAILEAQKVMAKK